MKLQSINPYNNQLIEEFEEFDTNKVNTTIEKVAESYKTWRISKFKSRAELMLKVSELLLKKSSELARTITTEMGKPIMESIAEIKKCAWVCKYYAENAEKHLKPELIKSDAYQSLVMYEPLGIILGIMPWNFPFWQVFRFLAPTLMAGNTALLKHASNVQGCALQIEDIINEASFQKDVFRTLIIKSDKVREVIKNDRVKAVTLTGSEQAGCSVAELAGSQIKKTVLELGGSNAFIVLNDCDIDKAVEVGISARFMNAGQSCIAAKRFIIDERIADEYIKKFKVAAQKLKIGDPLNNETNIGPLVSELQAKEVERQVEESIKLGAKAIITPKRESAFFYPTILTNITTNMPVFKEEVFGPVAPILTFKEVEEAIEISNNSRFSLGVSLITSDINKAKKLVPEFNEGAVFINSLVKSDPRLPFGGIKKSGYGRELSKIGIHEFVNAKTVYIEK